MLTPEFKALNPYDGKIGFSADKNVGGGHAPRSTTIIDASFFNRPAAEVAKDLIGRILVSNIGGKEVSGIIVETTAYTGKSDPQSHDYKVRQGQSVDWQAGALYIYSTQGHTMLTVISAPFKDGATVLIRALEPLSGIDEMTNRHGEAANSSSLTKGPGKLSKAMGITPDYNGHNVLSEGAQIKLLPGFELSAAEIKSSKRKGDKSGVVDDLRFFRAGNEWVS